MSSLQRLNC